jgi:ABC-type branched-subunit amino acid transport system substrate-binding protein
MLRTRRFLAVAAVLAVIAAGCGDDDDDSASSATTASTAAGAAGASTTAGATTGGAASGAAEPGITATQITIGNVATLTGPVPGLFQGAQFGVVAYVQYVNSTGGVAGRQLALKTGDDGLDCSQDQSQTEGLVSQVFAFVGSFSLFDNCAAKVFADHLDVPNVSYALTPDAFALANTYSIEPRPPGFRTGPFQYYAQQFPDAVKKVGSVYQASSQGAWDQEKAAMESVGYSIAYERGAQTSETDFTADILRMKDAGVQFIWLSDLPVPSQAQFLSAMQQQGYKPKVVMTAGTAYDGTFFKQLPDPAAAEGMYTDMQYELFLDTASTVPEVQLFQQWLKKTHPDAQPDLFAVFGWASASLFVDAVKTTGDQPTRQGVLDALAGIHDFDANGLIAPVDVGGKQPPECWILVQVKDGKWQRVTPQSGYQCDPGGYYLYKG